MKTNQKNQEEKITKITEKETLLTTRRKLKKQVDILIASSEDYLTQIAKCVRELKIICRKEVER
jgi:hypothetical protein